MTPLNIRYQPFYCEENAWWLCQEPFLREKDPRVVFVSNPSGHCLLWHQRAASPGQPVVWDYHVIVITKVDGQVWDPDTRLGIPVPARGYLKKSFSSAIVPNDLKPFFRVVPAERFVQVFSTDRSHMRDRNGKWIHPPPAWDPPGSGVMNLMSFVNMVEPFEGEVLSLSDLLNSVAPSD